MASFTRFRKYCFLQGVLDWIHLRMQLSEKGCKGDFTLSSLSLSSGKHTSSDTLSHMLAISNLMKKICVNLSLVLLPLCSHLGIRVNLQNELFLKFGSLPMNLCCNSPFDGILSFAETWRLISISSWILDSFWFSFCSLLNSSGLFLLTSLWELFLPGVYSNIM